MRLDRAVAARGLARSRTHAQALIAAGSVCVNGVTVTRVAEEVSDDAAIEVVADADRYVSRAAHKLNGALDAWSADASLPPLTIAGVAAMDVGASTGGFTQVLLERGASTVLAVDVGRDQLAATIASDPRVTVAEGLHVRDVPHWHTARELPAPGVITADLSFISLTLAIEPMLAVAAPDADLLLLVKPQFELDRAALDKHGVVTKPALRGEAIRKVCAAATQLGLAVVAITTSVLPGPAGNVEFFVWARRSWQARDAASWQGLTEPAIDDAIRRCIGRTP